jgi:FKBP-type peptidyl-prolyl cis-trans isomerase SlyD
MTAPILVADDHVVTIHYTLRDVEGSVRDSSAGSDPLPYLHGHGNIVPGLEAALAGKTIGDKIEGLHVPPEQGYGLHDENLDLAIPAASFPDEMRDQLDVGIQFVAEHPENDEQTVLYTVLGHDEDDDGPVVLVSGNHPLAGDVLVFDVEIIGIRPATADELEHGHSHGEGGHHH